MARYDLLDAVNQQAIRTTADVAAELGVSQEQAERELRSAQGHHLVFLEFDESINVGRDFEREFWVLTKEGRDEWERLDAEQGT